MHQANLGQQIHPALIGQSEVKQHHVKAALADLRHAFARRTRDGNVITFERQQGFQRLADRKLVVDD